jgi:hypothetical protein
VSEYAFRLRFDLAPGYRIAIDAQYCDLPALNGKRLLLRTGKAGSPIKDSARAAVLSQPYATADEALKAAENVKAALLHWAVEQRVGVDFGGGPPRGIVTDAGLAELQRQSGLRLRNDVHGIDVYEAQPEPRFVHLTADAVAGKNPENLIRTLNDRFQNGTLPTAKQTLASEIYTGSFFDVSSRSRFITLVTAVEALLQLGDRPEPVQMLVNDLVDRVRGSNLEHETIQSIVSNLKWLKKNSIRGSGQKLAASLLEGHNYDGRNAAEFFKYAYDLRSQIVHDGRAKDASINMLAIANAMETFVSDLLLASLRNDSA